MTDIYLAGCGQRSPWQLTFETVDVLSRCTTVLTLLEDDAIDGLPELLAAKCESVRSRLDAGRERFHNYDEIVDFIIQTAKSAPPVGWLTYGNPMIVDSLSHKLIGRARDEDLVTAGLPAVSSIDSVLNDVEHDPGKGLLVVECTDAVLRNTVINPSIATMLFQPATFMNRFPQTSRSAKADLSDLSEFLLKFYEPAQPVAFVTSSQRHDEAALVEWLTVATLNEVTSVALTNCTMFIPPVELLFP